MFTTNEKSEGVNEHAHHEPSAHRKQSAGRARVASIIASGVKVTGTIEADGVEVQVDGEIEGSVLGGLLTIGETGAVKGDIVSDDVTVHGRVEGSVRARKVTLARNANVLGDIVHQSLSIEMGAVFEGQCRYLQDPLSQSGPAPQSGSMAKHVVGLAGARHSAAS